MYSSTGLAIIGNYPEWGETFVQFFPPSTYAEIDAQNLLDALHADVEKRPKSLRGSFRIARVTIEELPDDIDADNERTMERIKTADEMANDVSYLDHPALD